MSSKSSKAFRSWRIRMGLTQKQAAAALKLAENTVGNYDYGRRCDVEENVIVPHHVLLACAAIEARLSAVC